MRGRTQQSVSRLIMTLYISSEVSITFCVSLAWILSTFPVCTLAGNGRAENDTGITPLAGSASSAGVISQKESILTDVDIKSILVGIAALLAVITTVVICVLCWKCCCRDRDSICKPRSHQSTCSSCACFHSHSMLAHHVCMNHLADGPHHPSNGIAATIYDSGRYCHCMSCVHDIHINRNVTPPPAYPMGGCHSLSNVTQSHGRAGSACRCGIGDASSENVQEAGIPLSSSPSREVAIPLTSRISDDVTRLRAPRNDVETGLRENPIFGSLTSSRTSNVTSNVVFYTPNDQSVVLGRSPHSSIERHGSDSVVNGAATPLNIECPGLFEMFPAAVRDLFVPEQRSERRTVAGKLVVSLAREVDHKGDHLVLDNMGISLWIPPGAVPYRQRQLVCLVLNWDLSDFPPLENQQALISPVVYCGPHGLRLEKPCVLSFKHCAFDPRMVQVMSSQTELLDQKDWRVMCSAEDGTEAAALTTSECQIRLQHFSLFTCVQTPPDGARAKKWLQIAAFCAPLQREVHHYQVRVYFLNKTPCALQWAIQNEAKFGFRLACPERTFLFEGSGEDMHLTVGYVSRGWCAIKDDHGHVDRCGEDDERVSFHSIWQGKCPYLSFCFKRACISDQPKIFSHSAPTLAPGTSNGGHTALYGGRSPSDGGLYAPNSDLSAPGGGHSGLGASSAGRSDSFHSGVTSSSALPGKISHHVSEINIDFTLYQDSSANTPEHMNLLLTEPKDSCAGTASGLSRNKQEPGDSSLFMSKPDATGSFLSNPDTANFPKLSEDCDNVPSCSETRFFPTCNRHEVSISMPAMHVESGMIRGKVKIDPNASGSNVLVDFEREYDCTQLPASPHGGERREVFPHELRVNLREKLDPNCPFGNDWRLLASKVGLDSRIRWLTARESPTMYVLSHMENLCMGLACLHSILQDMGRLDAASDVQEFIAASRSKQNGVEHSDDASVVT